MTRDLSFVAFGVETANQKYGSMCVNGIIFVRNGVRVNIRSWLRLPPAGIDRLAAVNIGIHKIKPEDLSDRLRLAELWPEVLAATIDGLPIHMHDSVRTAQRAGERR